MFTGENGDNPVPLSYRGLIIGVVVITSLATYFYEKIIIWYLTIWDNKRV
jgi:hypothetical protein